MFFLADSNLFYITLARKKGFGFGTFGLGQKHEELTVRGVLKRDTFTRKSGVTILTRGFVFSGVGG